MPAPSRQSKVFPRPRAMITSLYCAPICRREVLTLAGQTFEHMVYHFVLTYSNWETGTICYSESLESLSEGWQNAVWELGAVAAEHRTDSLSSAVNNMSNLEEFNRRYQGVMTYYGVKPRHTNPASPNENGDVEQATTDSSERWSRRCCCAGAAILEISPGTRSFSRNCSRSGSGSADPVAEEMAVMRELPARR